MPKIEESDGWTHKQRKESNGDKLTLWGYVYNGSHNPSLIDVLNGIIERVEAVNKRLTELQEAHRLY